jgi:glycerol uptake facilitator-like aquaporin
MHIEYKKWIVMITKDNEVSQDEDEEDMVVEENLLVLIVVKLGTLHGTILNPACCVGTVTT